MLSEIRKRCEKAPRLLSPSQGDIEDIASVFTDFIIDAALAFKDRRELLLLVERCVPLLEYYYGEFYRHAEKSKNRAAIDLLSELMPEELEAGE